MTVSVTIKDVPSSLFIAAYADYLKKSGQIESPSWLDMVKTGSHKSYSPKNPDWFFTRLETHEIASLARKFYIKGFKGVGSLRKEYGGKKRRGVKPSKKKKSSGKIIRLALFQLQKLGIIEKDQKGKRRLSKKAQQDMDIRSAKLLSFIKS